MPSIVFVLPGGAERRVTVAAGTSVMHAAVDHDVPGIVGECGGCASCATCHVWVDPAWADRLEPADEVEDDLLGFAEAERRPTSRLGCQIAVDDALDGLRVEVPPLP
jgi:2Fe-2S ferredoxin